MVSAVYLLPMKNLLVVFLFISFGALAKDTMVCADSMQLRRHVYTITGGPAFRNITDTTTLNKTSRYIQTELGKYTRSVTLQPYQVDGKEYRNIIASYGPENAPRIIIGAHYDVCDEQAGADDNASGVAGLLELARMLSKEDASKWQYRIDLVAYTLEEPPSFKTANMGSTVHARHLAEAHVPVLGMISLEMIGYYKDAKHTQKYPLGFFKWFYGTRGNYVTVVKKLHGGKFVRQFTRGFKHGDNIITKVFAAPSWVPGVDWSDHLSYWAYGWQALMITDTSFFRNANYHEKTDTPDTLDYSRMSFVVTNLFNALSKMAKG